MENGHGVISIEVRTCIPNKFSQKFGHMYLTKGSGPKQRGFTNLITILEYVFQIGQIVSREFTNQEFCRCNIVGGGDLVKNVVIVIALLRYGKRYLGGW